MFFADFQLIIQGTLSKIGPFMIFYYNPDVLSLYSTENMRGMSSCTYFKVFRIIFKFKSEHILKTAESLYLFAVLFTN